jgi:hypothetical protein
MKHFLFNSLIVCIGFFLLVLTTPFASFAQNTTNKALYFDGGDKVVIPSSPDITFYPSSEFSIECWFNPTSFPGTFHILGKRDCYTSEPASNNYQFARDGRSLLHMNSGGDVVSAGVDPPVNEWTHLAVTYKDSFLVLYLGDSVKVATPYIIQGASDVPFVIGASGNCWAQFVGYIDEVRIWHKALTPAEMKGYYNRPLPPSMPGLIGYWNFDDSTDDQVVHDVSPSHNNGSLGADTAVGGDDPIRVVSTAPLVYSGHDASVERILWPDTVVSKDSIVIPRVLVRNLAFETDTIPVHLKIGNFYDETSTIILASLDSGVVSFPPWTASTLGSFPIITFSTLQGDSAVFNDSVKSRVAVIVGGSFLAIFGTSLDNGGNSGIVSVTIHGQGFYPGATTKLSRQGYQDIVGVNTTVIDFNTITTQLDLTGRQLGSWDLVVINPRGESASLPSSFTINEGFVNLWLDILGRVQIRVGREATYLVRFGNQGNVDAHDVFLCISTEPEVILKLDLPPEQFVPGTEDWQSISPSALVGSKVILPLWNYSIPAGTSSEIPIKLVVPFGASLNSISLDVRLFQAHPNEFSATGDPGFIGSSIFFKATVNAFDLVLNTDTSISGGDTSLANEMKQKVREELRELVNLQAPTLCSEVHPITWKDWTYVCFYQVWSMMPGLAGTVVGFGKWTFKEDFWTLCIRKLVEGINHYIHYKGVEDAYENAGMGSNSAAKTHHSDVVVSWDPNEKVGPTGFGANHAVSIGRLFDYRVYFENKDSATAAAQEVEVRDTLDSNLEWNTFSFGDFQIGDTLITVSDSSQVLNKSYHLNDTVDVDVEGTFNLSTGIIRWYIKGRDRRNGELADFLPPNKDSVVPRGEGWVSLDVRPKSNLVTGTQIKNRASIVFDVNPPILTNEVFNTIDANPPTSQITQIGPNPDSGTMRISWSGVDDSLGSGIQSYTLYAEEDQGAFVSFATNLMDTLSSFPAQLGHTYRFMTLAQDNVGNLEHWKSSTDQYVTMLHHVSKRWNMVSIPIIPFDARKLILFPTASSGAWTYAASGGGYKTEDTLHIGAGYWLKFPTAISTTITGSLVPSETINVHKGWNMIGSNTTALSIASIGSNPTGIVTSQFFGYQGGYVRSDSIHPGKAYWVKVSQDGQLLLFPTHMALPVSMIKLIPTDELPPPPPEESDAVIALPQIYALAQNYPNPFNPLTVIRYQLPIQSKVVLTVYNVLGQKVRTLVDEIQEAGFKSIEWNASEVASGVYFYRLQAGTFVNTKKLILLR